MRDGAASQQLYLDTTLLDTNTISKCFPGKGKELKPVKDKIQWKKVNLN